METGSVSFKQLGATSKHIARQLLTSGENRLELLTLEVQQEGRHLLQAMLFGPRWGDAGSELNRTQLADKLAELRAGVRTVTNRATSFSSMNSVAAVVVAGLAAFRRGQPGVAHAKLSWLQTMLKSAGMVSTCWLAFRAKGHDQQDKEQNTRKADLCYAALNNCTEANSVHRMARSGR